MRMSHAGGRKTQSETGRPAFGNALEERINTIFAALAKGLDDSVSRATGADCDDTRHQDLDAAARLGAACASLVSATARLNGEFKHQIQVNHVHEYVGEEEEDKYASDFDPEVPLFTGVEIRSFTHEDLMREIPIRQAAYWARKAAEAQAARPGTPAPLRAPGPVLIGSRPAPTHASEVWASDPQEDETEQGLHPALAAIEEQLGALQEETQSMAEED